MLIELYELIVKKQCIFSLKWYDFFGTCHKTVIYYLSIYIYIYIYIKQCEIHLFLRELNTFVEPVYSMFNPLYG